MSQFPFKKRAWAALTPSASFVHRQVRRGMEGWKVLPRTVARSIRQPCIQYRIVLLLAAILAILLWWSMSQSVLPDTVALALMRHLL